MTLIERLQTAKKKSLSIGECWNLMDEAADAIEALQAENEFLKQDHNAPEYIVCAELIRLNKALSGSPTPPEAK